MRTSSRKIAALSFTEKHREAAKEAGLRYVSDQSPGIYRFGKNKKFFYKDSEGRRIRDAATLQRIRMLAIPPAYTSVWICADPRGHIQATGLDARGRKQYRYHPEWRAVRDQHKYDRVVSFGEVLPIIRKTTNAHLSKPGLGREKVLAAVVQLLEKTLIRVGNEEYVKENKSFGLTTLLRRHVDVRGSKITFEFKGKSRIHHTIDINDRRLAKIIRGCQDLPGQELFQYIDEDGQRRMISSDDVNNYLQEITDDDFTAKDFRTWTGTVLAAHALAEMGNFGSMTEAKRKINMAIEHVSKKLGNTKAICRKCYVHPVVINAYLHGTSVPPIKTDSKPRETSSKLTSGELVVLKFLKKNSKQYFLKAA